MDERKAAGMFQNIDITFIVALVVVIISLTIFLIYRSRKTARRAILLTGLCDSGKTLLFSQVVHGKYVNTQTSIKQNIGEISTDNGVLTVVDIPGHERLRYKFLDTYKSMARGIVYVVDSVTLQQDIRDAAEYLYNILIDPVISGHGLSLLILCNKQDLSLAKSINVIQSMLEKELNTLCVTKSSQLESVDPKFQRAKDLIEKGKDFTFDALHSVKVQFAQSFITGKDEDEGVDLVELNKWLTNVSR